MSWKIISVGILGIHFISRQTDPPQIMDREGHIHKKGAKTANVKVFFASRAEAQAVLDRWVEVNKEGRNELG